MVVVVVVVFVMVVVEVVVVLVVVMQAPGQLALHCISTVGNMQSRTTSIVLQVSGCMTPLQNWSHG